MNEEFIGYMCKTDYDYDVRSSEDGAHIYPTEEDLREKRECVRQCGIVKVRVIFDSVVQDEDYSNLTVVNTK